MTPAAPPISLGGRLASIAVSLGAALVILGISIVPFLTPQWIHFEQDRSGAATYFGGDATVPNRDSDAIVHDLVFGGSFEVGALRLQPLLDEKERAHMRDVRVVFQELGLIVLAGATVVAWTFRRSDASGPARAAWWRAVARGGGLLATIMVVVGLLAVVAFDAMFEIFHELLFPAGSFTFDPAKEHLVQLYPDQFWSDTTLALGVVALAIALGTWWWGRRRAERSARAMHATPTATSAVRSGSVS